MELRLAILLAVLSFPLPREDRRNSDIPHTKTHFTMPVYKSLEEWSARRERLRRQILIAAGLWPMPEKQPLRPLRFGRIERARYTVEKVLLETLPGYYLGGNLYLPARRGRFPGVLIAHGHWKHGRVEDLDSYSVPRLGANLAAQGYVAFAYDMAGYNDTRQTRHDFGGSASEQLWSFNPLGLQLWNSIRALDFLESLPEVDAARLGSTGASGGGTQVFLLSAVDNRVKVSAPVNMVSAIMQGGSPCENAPGLRVKTSNVEIAAMAAPRTMLLVSATGDWTRNTPRQEFPEIARVYQLYKKPDNVAFVQFDAGHNYDRRSREAVYRFFRRHLRKRPENTLVLETETSSFQPEDLLIRPWLPLPPGALAEEDLFRWWRAQAASETARMEERELRERMAATIGAEWPGRVQAFLDGERIVLSAGHGDRVPGLFIPGRSGVFALIVHPGGAEEARRTPEAERLARAGASLLLLDVFQTGSARAPRDRGGRYFLTFNRSDDAHRVQDILTGLAFLAAYRPAELRLVGLGEAAVWAVFAAAIAPGPIELSADLNGFAGTDEELRKGFFVPGIQRAGGLDAALRLLDRPSGLAARSPAGPAAARE